MMNYREWLKTQWFNVVIVIVLLVLTSYVIYIHISVKSLDKQVSNIWFENFINKLTSTTLDFSNKGGLVKAKTKNIELLLSTQGSVKKGEGYVVNLGLLNASSIIAVNPKVTFTWIDNGNSKTVTINPLISVGSGKQAIVQAFLSPLQGDSLRSIDVEVEFEQSRYSRQY